MGKLRKISDKEFLTILRENAGLYARTAKAIERQFGVPYTRQAVRDRADKFPEEYADILEENVDVAEDGLHSLMQSGNENVKLRAIELYLKTRGKQRGYIERTETVDKTAEAEQTIKAQAQVIRTLAAKAGKTPADLFRETLDTAQRSGVAIKPEIQSGVLKALLDGADSKAVN